MEQQGQRKSWIPARRRARAGSGEREISVTACRVDDPDILKFPALEHASSAQKTRFPEFSAGTPAPRWQFGAAALVTGGLAGAAAVLPRETTALVFLAMTAPFVCVALLRLFALTTIIAPASRRTENWRSDDALLPVYSVIVPLYREAAVAGDLVLALSAVNYPADKLDILLVVEERDEATIAALRAVVSEDHFRVIIVPDGLPRTKPRALNYALAFAVGEMVVVYDAEDLPEPNQLRAALAALMRSPKIACVQARLVPHNAHESWLAAQFTVEYAVLFGAVLPGLQRLGLPIPLGGTSNHFRRDILESSGAWDPFNVTEDADLGIRLARLGFRVEVIASSTWEEAPVSLRIWFGQRTRWLKGWMQTYLVHMRAPRRVMRELGVWPFVGLQILMGGIVLSALIHPWFYVYAAIELMSGRLGEAPETRTGQLIQSIALFNFIAGYCSGVLLGVAVAAREKRYRLIPAALTMPLYWLLISAAGYRALIQLGSAPFHWEKTQHRARTRNGD